MFNKLLSNLPFNPSLIDQVSFYSKRLRKEAGIRRMGFLFMALAFAFQIFAVSAPTEASTQGSSNDVIYGGFDTKEQAYEKCINNTRGFGAIFLHYGMSCEKIRSAGTQTINTSTQGDKLFSMGRIAQNKRGEYAVKIEGAGTFYLRHLSSWGNFNTKVLVMQTSDNKPFYVMYDCGNIVIEGGYTPPAQPAPPSKLKLAKVNEPTGAVKPGDYINYVLAFSNTGGNSAFFAVHDQLPDQVDFVSSEQGNWAVNRNGNKLDWNNNSKETLYSFGNTDAYGTPGFIKLRVKVKSDVKSGTVLCNKGWLIDVNITTKQPQRWSDVSVCNTVVYECPNGQIPNSNGDCETPTVPDAACLYLKPTAINRTKYKFEAESSLVNGATVSAYTYSFGDGSNSAQHKSTSTKDSIEHEFSKPGTYKVTVVVATSVADKTALTCQTQVTVDKELTPMVVPSKKAANLTKKIDDANNTTASAGDVIEYSLTVKNFGDGTAEDYVMQPEDLSDVLEYADIDLNSLNGGVFEQDNHRITWLKPINIKAGESVTKKFKVTVKNPIPSTLRPNNAPGNSFDMVMYNKYGNDIQIKLPPTILKTAETTSTSLPNTGPGESLAIGGLITTIIGYFFARSRLLAKELDIVRNEYATTNGGM